MSRGSVVGSQWSAEFDPTKTTRCVRPAGPRENSGSRSGSAAEAGRHRHGLDSSAISKHMMRNRTKIWHRCDASTRADCASGPVWEGEDVLQPATMLRRRAASSGRVLVDIGDSRLQACSGRGQTGTVAGPCVENRRRSCFRPLSRVEPPPVTALT